MDTKTNAGSLIGGASGAPAPQTASDGASSASADTACSASTVAGTKPRVALFLATVCGIGYIPRAPGTFGSLAGVLIYFLTQYGFPPAAISEYWGGSHRVFLPLAIALAAIGVWSANRVVQYSGRKDPQFVVIDEVSGQFIAYFFALVPLNWKYLLLGLILFRAFDIWKPFPARQAESLPGGWGIMTDDWVAGIYTAAVLWIARGLGM